MYHSTALPHHHLLPCRSLPVEGELLNTVGTAHACNMTRVHSSLPCLAYTAFRHYLWSFPPHYKNYACFPLFISAGEAIPRAPGISVAPLRKPSSLSTARQGGSKTSVALKKKNHQRIKSAPPLLALVNNLKTRFIKGYTGTQQHFQKLLGCS